MKNLKAILIDDDPLIQHLLKDLLNGKSVNIEKSFLNPELFLEALPNIDCDLFFIDIHMPEISGIDIARMLVNKPYIFITGTDSPGLLRDAISLSPVDILLKPVLPEKLNTAIEKAHHFIEKKQPGKSQTLLNITVNRGKTVVELENILLVETDTTDSRDKILYMNDGTILKAKRCKLEHLLALAGSLVKINKGTVISLNAVQNIEHNCITLKQQNIPGLPRQVCLGYAYRANFKRMLYL